MRTSIYSNLIAPAEFDPLRFPIMPDLLADACWPRDRRRLFVMIFAVFCFFASALGADVRERFHNDC